MKCFIFLTILLLVLMPQGKAVQAQCTAPPAEAGVLLFNKDHKVMQYCNGEVWVGLWGGGGTSSPPVCTGSGKALQWTGASWDCVNTNTANPPTVVTGIAYHNTQIPLPAGYAEADCKWMVSLRYSSTYSVPTGESQEIYCFTSSQSGHATNPVGTGRWVHCGKDYDNNAIVDAGIADYIMYCRK